MKVEIWPSCREVGKRAAGIIRRTLQRDPSAGNSTTGAVPVTADPGTVTKGERRKCLLALLGAVLIWGSTFVATKDALHAFPPLTLAALRFALALVLIWPLYARSRHRSPALPLGVAVLLGFFGVFLYFALQNWALLYCRAGTASLILASIPALTALGSRFFLSERIGPLRVTGILASMAGVAVLVRCENSTPAAGLSGANTTLAGVAVNPGGLLLIGAALAWAVYTVLGRRLSPSHHPILITFQTTLWGLVFLLPFALAEQQPHYLSVGRESWIVLLYLGAVASALPIFLWNYALKTFPASEAGIYLNLVPVVATTMGALLLGERFSLTEVLAGLLVIAGVVLAQRPKQRHDPGSGGVTPGAGQPGEPA
ncbi:MAG: DMT family transporter [Bacillota bacterium]